LFGTFRIVFVVGGVVLLGLAAFTWGVRPADYSWICVGVAAALFVYPLLSNLRRLGAVWGVLSTFAQASSVALAAALVWVGREQIQRIQIPPLNTLQIYASLVTWPIVALLGGIAFFPHVSRILANVDTLEGFGGKISLRQRREIEDDVEGSLQQNVGAELSNSKESGTIAVQEIAALQRGVRTQENRYRNIISAWAVLSRIITGVASSYGGADNLQLIRTNVALLVEKGVMNEQIEAEALALFAERNGFKAREAPIEAAEHRVYLDRAQALAEKLTHLLPPSKFGSAVKVDNSVRH
jgi:hypothetical protein